MLAFAPPWVRTDLMNSQEAAQAMPLETTATPGTDGDEILVEGAKAFRANAGPREHGLVSSFNGFASARFAGG